MDVKKPGLEKNRDTRGGSVVPGGGETSWQKSFRWRWPSGGATVRHPGASDAMAGTLDGLNAPSVRSGLVNDAIMATDTLKCRLL
jgi:hypothetical protein